MSESLVKKSRKKQTEEQEEDHDDKLSRHWLRRFMARNKDLTKKTPQQLSAHRAKCASRHTVYQWMQRLGEMYERHDILSGMQIWNVDETGLIDIPKLRKVICHTKGKAQQIVGKEKGSLTTCLGMCNAAGLKVPPMIIHKGANVQNHWKTNQNDALLRCSENGWISTDLFKEFGQHFLDFLRKQNLHNMKHLVILDGHSTHTYNSQFLDLMADSDVTVV